MESGTRLGHYEILFAIGKGGMGEVWKAKDADRLARFERETKLLASLNHPNIAAIHGFEEDNDTHCLVLELVEGDTLADQLKRGAISVEESLKLALRIAEALEAAHEKGVIHRDLKPANINSHTWQRSKHSDFGRWWSCGDKNVWSSGSFCPATCSGLTNPWDLFSRPDISPCCSPSYLCDRK